MDTKNIYKEVLFHEPPENFVKRIFPTEMTAKTEWERIKISSISISLWSRVFLFLWCVMCTRWYVCEFMSTSHKYYV